MNKLWMEIKTAILIISNAKIPHKWIFTCQRTPSPKEISKYYPLLTKIEKILIKFCSKRINQKLWPIGEEWKKDLNKINKISNNIKYTLDPIPDFIDVSNVRNIKKSIISLYKVLHKMTKIDAKNNTDL